MNVNTYILRMPYGLYLFGVYMQKRKNCMCYISCNKAGVAFCTTLFVLLMLFCEGRKSKQKKKKKRKEVKNFNNKRAIKMLLTMK